MGLSQLAGALLIQGAALVRDCCCLIFDRECSLAPCLRDTDCQFFPDCICIDGTCQDAGGRDDCPPGYTEIPQPDGKVKCEPNCVGEPCAGAEECGEGCVCVDGRCVPSSDAFFCIDGECQRGGDLVFDPADPDRPKGPYPTYQACCMSPDEDGNLCGCGFTCSENCNCLPSETDAEYEDYQECRASCCDPTDAGRCCYNLVEKNAKGVTTRVEWYECADSLNEDCVDGPITETADGGTRQLMSVFTEGLECNPDFNPPGNLPSGEGCPIPEYGACCILDGDKVIECIEEGKIVCDEMPDRPEDFPQYQQYPGWTTESKSARWQTCEDLRVPEPNGEEYACDDCNGEKDCACESDERCDLRECITCFDNDPSKRGLMVRAQAGVERQIGDVTASETVTYYIRNCVSDATGAQSPVTDREALLFIAYNCGDTQEFPITDEGSIQATTSGTLYATVAPGKPDVQVCLTLERDAVIKICDQCEAPNVTLDPNPQPANQNIRVRRFMQEPGDLFEWKPGYPGCLGSEILWVEDFYSGQYQDGVIGGSTSKTLFHLYSCENQVITKVPLDDAVIPKTQTTTNCGFGAGAGGFEIIHPNALDWSVSTKFENDDPAFTCVSEAGFDTYGLFPDMPSLPDDVDFICDGVPVLRGVNPLP